MLEVYEPPMDFIVLSGNYTGLDVSKRRTASGGASGNGPGEASPGARAPEAGDGEDGSGIGKLKL